MTENRRIVTLTTDFGLSDTYVGVMKGVLLGIAPNATLIDLTHAIAPQNLREASLRLEAAVPYFPNGTIHLVVVDPGVGSLRDAIVVESETCWFVAPDNGVLTDALRRMPARRIVRLREAARSYYRHPVSATFHGRDIFAPIAAHLANGLALEALGSPEESTLLQTLPVSAPHLTTDAGGNPALYIHVEYADRFGNLITDLTPDFWARWTAGLPPEYAHTVVEAGDQRWSGLARTFADVPVGAPLAYWGSAGRLEIAVRDGSAAHALALSADDSILLARFAELPADLGRSQ